jgi:hypothetical protein
MNQVTWNDKPYLGLFGNTVLADVVEELVADPESKRTVETLQGLCGCRRKAIRKAVRRLVKLNILLPDEDSGTFTVNRDSKIVIALTFLAYAVGDELHPEDNGTMEMSCRDYIMTQDFKRISGVKK